MSAPGRFLARWSRLKRKEAESGALAEPQVAPAQAAQLADGTAPTADPQPPTVVLPPIESLGPGSDFTAFLKEEVSESLRRAALKKLFADPEFNAMDGLDIYIDDYSIPDPIAPDVMRRLKQFETFLADPVAEADRDAGLCVDEAAALSAEPGDADGDSVCRDEGGDPDGAMQQANPMAIDTPPDQVRSAEDSDTLSVAGQNVPVASVGIQHDR